MVHMQTGSRGDPKQLVVAVEALSKLWSFGMGNMAPAPTQARNGKSLGLGWYTAKWLQRILAYHSVRTMYLWPHPRAFQSSFG